jgi:IS5 family transposase
VGQLSLADGLVRGRGQNRSLDRLTEAVDWSRFEHLLSRVYASVRGRPSYPPLVLFKCLLLQQWYRLSDPGLEEALGDRLSFRRFVGLALDEAVPDHSTLSRFRARLRQDNLAERLFNELNRRSRPPG